MKVIEQKGGRRPTRRSGRSIIRAHAPALGELAEKLGWRGLRGEPAFIFGMALLADRQALEKALEALSERDWMALAEWARGEAVSARLAHTAAQRAAEAARAAGGRMLEWRKAEAERCRAVWKQKELQLMAVREIARQRAMTENEWAMRLADEVLGMAHNALADAVRLAALAEAERAEAAELAEALRQAMGLQGERRKALEAAERAERERGGQLPAERQNVLRRALAAADAALAARRRDWTPSCKHKPRHWTGTGLLLCRADGRAERHQVTGWQASDYLDMGIRRTLAMMRAQRQAAGWRGRMRRTGWHGRMRRRERRGCYRLAAIRLNRRLARAECADWCHD